MYPSIRKSIKKLSLFLAAAIFFIPLSSVRTVRAEGPFSLTKGEQTYAKEKQTLTVAILDDWKPLSNRDSRTKKWQGLIVDLLENFGKETGLTIQYQIADNYRSAAFFVENGKADLMAAVGYPDAPNPYDTDLSVPFLRSQMLMLYNKNLHPDDALHYDIAEVRGYPVFSDNPHIHPQYFATPSDCLLAVRSEQAGMMYCDIFSGMSYLRSYENRDIIAIPLNTETLFSFAVSKQEAPFLRPLLNRFLSTIERGEINESLTENRQKIHSRFQDFVYYYPFEIISVCLTAAFLIMLGYTVYTRIRSQRHMLSYDYKESYITLANIFGEAALSYDCTTDTLMLFGSNASRLSLPSRIENFTSYLESPDKKVSLTKQQLTDILSGTQQPSENHLALSFHMTDGSWQHFELIFSLLTTDEAYQRPVSLIGCLKNTEKEHMEIERLTQLGLCDKTTGLFNRLGIEAELQKYLHDNPATDRDILMIVDVDFFKNFNDTYGHSCGDDVLICTASHMKQLFPEKVILSRWGGDEFFLYFIDGASRIELIKTQCRTLQEMLRNYRYEDRLIPVTLSMGGAVVGEQSLQDAFNSADQALYLIKEQGRNAMQIFEQN